MSEDRKIWEAYKRVVTPAKKKGKPSSARTAAAKPVAAKAAARQAAEKAPVKLPKLHAASPLKLDALERKREKSLRQGDIEIDARLDLHGMTQVEAFEALAHFMHKKCAAGKRHLLIITGKGRGGVGVLRTNLQAWLSQLPEAKAILAVRPASIKHGGEGAFYVVLRKRG